MLLSSLQAPTYGLLINKQCPAEHLASYFKTNRTEILTRLSHSHIFQLVRYSVKIPVLRTICSCKQQDVAISATRQLSSYFTGCLGYLQLEGETFVVSQCKM